jgi:hypothetical protein
LSAISIIARGDLRPKTRRRKSGIIGYRNKLFYSSVAASSQSSRSWVLWEFQSQHEPKEVTRREVFKFRVFWALKANPKRKYLGGELLAFDDEGNGLAPELHTAEG